MNKRILEIKQELIQTINESGLPIAVIDLILGDIRISIQPLIEQSVKYETEQEKKQATDTAEKEKQAEGE